MSKIIKFKGKKAQPPMIDITGAEIVQIQVSRDGKTIWVNREKACLLRICRIERLIVDDMRQKGKETK